MYGNPLNTSERKYFEEHLKTHDNLFLAIHNAVKSIQYSIDRNINISSKDNCDYCETVINIDLNKSIFLYFSSKKDSSS